MSTVMQKKYASSQINGIYSITYDVTEFDTFWMNKSKVGLYT